jgi:hypothetical protein|tara:strand:+ start:6730 stop:7104 length:375 start_codon:yes stop_codon:yes gene_type:complete
MDIFLERFAGKIDVQSLLSTIDDLKTEYVDDGITKEDLPPIITRLMMETVKFKKLPGPQKKKLIIGVLNHFIEQIDSGEKDSEFEVVLKSMVPPIIDGFASMLKLRKKLPKWLRWIIPVCLLEN